MTSQTTCKLMGDSSAVTPLFSARCVPRGEDKSSPPSRISGNRDFKMLRKDTEISALPAQEFASLKVRFLIYTSTNSINTTHPFTCCSIHNPVTHKLLTSKHDARRSGHTSTVRGGRKKATL
ncbi:hypothetical protein CEXT_524341 [Caerostris extrusa]|uniref:Uncharacterized protein n=1 Tax=Caerostris extrusa TaxID=172846 RepID=A0AAV4XNK7_CAEEX|nr:hypothetical protein CEXT_524341 [Caerostris extrusa]